MSQSKVHTDDLTVGGQQTTRHMCSVFGTYAKTTKKKHFKNEDERKNVLSMGKIFCSYSNTQYLII